MTTLLSFVSMAPEETSFHLFFGCPFSVDCWSSISIHWNLNLQPLDMIIQARIDLGSHVFMEIFIAACWMIGTLQMGSLFIIRLPLWLLGKYSLCR
jgi:hypothetical protein